MAGVSIEQVTRRVTGIFAASGTLAVRVGGRALAFLSAFVLARLLGADGYGIYVYAVAWTGLLTLPTTVGLDRLLVRMVATYDVRRSFGLLRGLVATSARATAAASIGAMLLVAGVAVLVVPSEFETALLISLPVILIQGLTQVHQSTLQGLHHPELSLLPTLVVVPAVLVGLALGADAAGLELDASLAVVLNIGATSVALALAYGLSSHFLKPLILGQKAIVAVSAWARGLAPFTAMALLLTASSQIGVIMLGFIGTAEDAGVFQVANRASQLVALPALAVAASLSPKVVRFFEHDDPASLQRVSQSASRISVLLSLPIAATLIVGQDWVLGLFGSGFKAGGTALLLLVLAQLVNTAVGTVGIILQMTGRARNVAQGVAIALALDLILCITLIPSLGATGAAVARTADLIVWNAVLTVIVVRALGLNPTVIPISLHPHSLQRAKRAKTTGPRGTGS